MIGGLPGREVCVRLSFYEKKKSTSILCEDCRVSGIIYKTSNVAFKFIIGEGDVVK
jgi:hypothetical protein